MDSYKHFGMGKATERESISFERIGTNYKLSNVLAAIGVVQMRHVVSLLERRRELASRYQSLLAGVNGVRFPEVTPGGRHSFQSFCIFVENRNHILTTLRAGGIEVQIGTYSLHMHKAFASNSGVHLSGDMKGSRYAFDHCLTLPLYHDMKPGEQDRVVSELIKLL
jgi:dTDP-4-amino-4,6-dideoxygalactose transaminase